MKIPDKFIFVLMPFDKSFDDIYTYGIKQTSQELNAYCERVDEQIFKERILDRIYNQISKADVVIADMTERNPNVFYEVGYAHGIGKDVILLTQNADDIPFDLKHFPHIIYDGEIKKLNKELKIRLEWFLNQEEKESKKDFEFGLDFLYNGERIENKKIIEFNPPGIFNDFHEFKIDIYNGSSKPYKESISIGLEFPTEFDSYFLLNTDIVKTSPNKSLITSPSIDSLYPGAFKNVSFAVNHAFQKDTEPIAIDIVMKIFTPNELREIPIKIIIPTGTKKEW